MTIDQSVLHAGADELIVKPCREADLLGSIRVHLGLAYVYAAPATGRALTSIDDSSICRSPMRSAPFRSGGRMTCAAPSSTAKTTV